MERLLHSSLRKSLLCSGLPNERLTDLARLVVYERHQTGDILFEKGASADRFFVVLEGHVVLFLDAGPDPSEIARVVRPGETFAVAAICGQGTYPMTAEVLGPALLAAIPGRALRELLEQRFDLVLQILTTLSFQLRSLVRQISDLKMKSAAQRLGSYLLELVPPGREQAVIHLPYPKKLLAHELGMQPETLSRALAKLQSVGVKVSRHGVAGWQRRADAVNAVGNLVDGGAGFLIDDGHHLLLWPDRLKAET